MKEKIKDLEFITYGICFDPSLFIPAVDFGERRWLNKPKNGLWGCPVDSDSGWKDWCLENEYNLWSFDSWTKFKISPESRILVIDTWKDFVETLKKYHKKKYLDFENIINDYDGMFLTSKGNSICHLAQEPILLDGIYEYSCDLNCWDVESIVVFRKEILDIKEVHEKEEIPVV